jgi:Rha family phage regulatory protein
MINELVFVGHDGQAVTNSVKVAEKFGKEHKHVLESIRKLMTAENSAVLQMFEESTYINEQNKTQPMYLMNRDGFTLLAMGFTGTKAMEFKIDYINAFNKMESKIKKSLITLPDFTDPAEAAMAWAKEYREKKVLAIENKKLEEENIQLAAENQELKHDKNYLDLIMRSKALLTISQIAQDYGMSGKALNKKLADMGIQYSINGQWILYAKYKDCGYVSSRSIDITRADGRPDVVLHTEWTQAGRKFLYEELKKEGIIPMLERD